MKSTCGPLILCLFVTCWASPPRSAASDPVSDPSLGPACYGPLSPADKEAFFAFDRELRAALTGEDAVAMAFLVELPMRVNYPDGSAISLTNARSIQTRFDEVFPPALRSAVLNTKLEDIDCTTEGAMYGRGRIWVQAASSSESTIYRIFTVNLLEATSSAKRGNGWSLDFACDTKTARIAIDSDANRSPRYRAWTKPRPLADPADIVITGGSEDFPGTGPCRYREWSFQNDTRRIVLGLVSPCAPDETYPPGATAELTITAGEDVETYYCY